MIIGGVVLKRKEKAPGSAPKPYTRYLLIGGPVLLAAAIVIVVLDPDSRKQFTDGFDQGEKAGKEAAAKVLPKVPEKPPAPAAQKAAAASPDTDKPQTAAKAATAKPGGETAAAAEQISKPSPEAPHDSAAAEAPRTHRSLVTNRDLRKCLDLESNLEIIKCAERS